MITLIILKSNAKDIKYGFGTYISELTESLLKTSDINIIILSYNYKDCKEFVFKTRTDRFIEIYIPDPSFHLSPNTSLYNRYALIVVRLLSEFIPENGKVIFQMNYLDDLPIVSKLKEKYKYPVIYIVHSSQWQEHFNGNYKKLTRFSIERSSNNSEFALYNKEKDMYWISDHIVSLTRYMKDFLTNEYNISPDRITVIPNGLNYKGYRTISAEERNTRRQKLGFEKNEIIILFSGRIDPGKGIFYLLDAFEKACMQNSDLRLVLLGEGYIQDCQRNLQSSFGKVTFTGFLPKELVFSFYLVADIGIVPSIYDQCPYSILEMMANRIPLILSRINGLNELLSDEDCLFIDPEISEDGGISFNIIELATAILKLARDKKLRKNLGDHSNQVYSEKFTASRMAEDMTNLFNGLLKCNNWH